MLLVGCVQEPIPVPVGDDVTVACHETTHEGFPRLEPGLKNSYFVCHEGFALQYAKPLRSALWVSQRLTADTLDEQKVTRDKEEFRPDGRLPADLTPAPDRFTRTGYDRGHLAPAADFKENPVGMSHSFYTSNIVPQDPDNNRGIWADLEQNVRRWAMEKGEVYVITGPIFYAHGQRGRPLGWLTMKNGMNDYVIEEYQRSDRKRPAVPPNSIAVPSHLYKVVLDPKTNQAIAFVVPNVNVPEQQLPQFATTVAEVEKLTALRFFPMLTFEQQAALKTQVQPEAWLIR